MSSFAVCLHCSRHHVWRHCTARFQQTRYVCLASFDITQIVCRAACLVICRCWTLYTICRTGQWKVSLWTHYHLLSSLSVSTVSPWQETVGSNCVNFASICHLTASLYDCAGLPCLAMSFWHMQNTIRSWGMLQASCIKECNREVLSACDLYAQAWSSLV